MELFNPPTPSELAERERTERAALAKLKKLHRKLAKADECTADLQAMARKIDFLAVQIGQLWPDLPGYSGRVFDAADMTRSRMEILLAALDSNRRWQHYPGPRGSIRETLDDVCEVIANYRERGRNE